MIRLQARPASFLVLALLTVPAFAGCIQLSGETLGADALATPSLQAIVKDLNFSAPVILDKVRAGGEPGIVVTPTGTILVATHPGYTHFTQPDPNLLLGQPGQTYMWRSTDGGATWTYVGLPVANAGPRNGVPSVSDPDFTLDKAGNVYYSDLFLMDISVQKSEDDGATWMQGNPIVAHQPARDDPTNVLTGAVDRNWIAADEANVVYALWQGDRGIVVAKSTDGGLTFPQHVPLDIDYQIMGKMIVDWTSGAVLVPLATPEGVKLAKSDDGGLTWTDALVRATEENLFNIFPTIAADRAGNYYMLWSEGAEAQRVYFSASTDQGETWTTATPLSKEGYTSVFPWIVAGDEGRVAALWLEAHEAAKPNDVKGGWHIHAVYSLNAHEANPAFAGGRIAPDNHQGSICMGGVGCALSTPRGDRRLGDYFTATLDPEGFVNVAYADTTLGGGIAHPAFVKQVAGPRLLTKAG